MVIVDSSAWIDLLRGRETPETAVFERLAAVEEIGIGDLILYEVLQGVTPESAVANVQSRLLVFPVFIMGGRDLALLAAANTRLLRSNRVQVSTIDCLIATFCISGGHRLLTSDHHFQPFADKLGLTLAK